MKLKKTRISKALSLIVAFTHLSIACANESEGLTKKEPSIMEFTPFQSKPYYLTRHFSKNISFPYLRINYFSKGLHKKIPKELSSIEGTSVLVIDLSKNSGGYLNEAVQIAGIFNPNAPLIKVKADVERIIYSGSGANINWTGTKIYLIVDESTASSAEIFTHALHSSSLDVTILGKKTYGKKTIDTVFPEKDKLYQKKLWPYELSGGKHDDDNSINPDVETDTPLTYIVNKLSFGGS